jgi:uncharacterized membrane protein
VTGGQMMVVLIVAIVMIASVLRGPRRIASRNDDGPEAERLRQEVKALKERLAVLERITVEKENSLEREIEQLRDK